MSRKPATCPQIVLDWIAWYPDAELPADVRSAIELHAAECGDCRQEIANLSGESVVDAAASSGAERVFARTLERISAQPRPAARPPQRRFWMVRPRLALAAGLAVAVTSGTVGMIATQQLGGALDPAYTPATAAVSHGHDVASAHLDVVFRGDASFAEISSAMQAIGANVASGPTPNGVVHLHLAQGVDAHAAARRLESGDLQVAEFAQPAP